MDKIPWECPVCGMDHMAATLQEVDAALDELNTMGNNGAPSEGFINTVRVILRAFRMTIDDE